MSLSRIRYEDISKLALLVAKQHTPPLLLPLPLVLHNLQTRV